MSKTIRVVTCKCSGCNPEVAKAIKVEFKAREAALVAAA